MRAVAQAQSPLIEPVAEWAYAGLCAASYVNVGSTNRPHHSGTAAFARGLGWLFRVRLGAVGEDALAYAEAPTGV